MSQEKINLNPDIVSDISDTVKNNSPASSASDKSSDNSITSIWLEGESHMDVRQEDKATDAEDAPPVTMIHESIVFNETTEQPAAAVSTHGIFSASQPEESPVNTAPIRGCCVVS